MKRRAPPLLIIAATAVILLVMLAVFAPLVAPYDPLDQSVLARFRGPSAAHWLGTDQFGRDLLSRVIYGLRASLDKKAGGEIAQSLDALYQFMSKRLLLANLKDDPVILEEVRSLLADLKSAWVGLEQQTSMSGTQSLAARPQASAYFNTGVAA